MSEKSSYVNSFTFSIQNFNCILDAKCTAPNIEKTEYGTPPVFDAHKIVDETYLFMPLGVAKELALSMMQVIADMEKRPNNIRVRLNGEKENYWQAAVKAIDEYKAEKEGSGMNG